VQVVERSERGTDNLSQSGAEVMNVFVSKPLWNVNDRSNGQAISHAG
jgi:hypothetical protein